MIELMKSKRQTPVSDAPKDGFVLWLRRQRHDAADQQARYRMWGIPATHQSRDLKLGYAPRSSTLR